MSEITPVCTYDVQLTVWRGLTTKSKKYETNGFDISILLDEASAMLNMNGADYICVELHQRKKI